MAVTTPPQDTCAACEFDAPKVDEIALNTFLSANTGWTLQHDQDIRKIKQTYRFKNFADAMVFTNAVAALAERHGHHPTIITEWGAVSLEWWSHKIKDLHQLDLELAGQCDVLFQGKSHANLPA
jgi:4a-hydroxytetrahydrobiopterin dehydratase